MAKELRIGQNRLIRVNPNDDTRMEYWHDGANKWMDDGGVPGHVVDIEHEENSNVWVILTMRDGKKYRRDGYDGTTREIKEKKKQSKEESNTEEPPKKSEMGSYEMPPMMGGMTPPTMSNDTSSKKSSSIFVKIFKVIWWIVKLPFKILKFIYKMIPG